MLKLPCSRRRILSNLSSIRCVGDVTASHQRAHYLSQLEAVNNVAQAIGPFVGGILSSYSLDASMYSFF